MVTRLVVDTQEADVDTTGGEHGNLKLGTNRRAAPRFRAHRRHEVHFGLNVAFVLSGKALDTPHNRVLLRFVFRSAKRMLNLCLGRVLRHWNLDDHVRRKELI